MLLAGQVKRVKETWTNAEHGLCERSQSELDEEHPREKAIGLVNELKRNKSKQIVLSLLQPFEILGLDEVLRR